jgi:hypothetical protein
MRAFARRSRRGACTRKIFLHLFTRDSRDSSRTTLDSHACDKDYHGGLIGLRSGCVRIGARTHARTHTHTRLRIEDYTEYPEVGRLRAPGKREGAEKSGGGGWLSTISSNQAKANYKFNSELCTGDN